MLEKYNRKESKLEKSTKNTKRKYIIRYTLRYVLPLAAHALACGII